MVKLGEEYRIAEISIHDKRTVRIKYDFIKYHMVYDPKISNFIRVDDYIYCRELDLLNCRTLECDCQDLNAAMEFQELLEGLRK